MLKWFVRQFFSFRAAVRRDLIHNFLLQTSILAAIGAGFGVRWAARKMKMRQHPFFEDHSRIAANYEEYHNRGILDDAGYFIGMLKLKQWRQFYGPVLPGLRDPVLPASQGAAEAREKSQSGFEVDMSREEARQVLGMTTAYVEFCSNELEQPIYFKVFRSCAHATFLLLTLRSFSGPDSQRNDRFKICTEEISSINAEEPP